MRLIIWKRNSGTSEEAEGTSESSTRPAVCTDRSASLGAHFRTDPKTTVGARDRDGGAHEARSYPNPCNFPFLGLLGCVALPVRDPSSLITNRSYAGRGIFSGLLVRCSPRSSPSLQARPQTIRVWLTDKDLKAKKSQGGRAAPSPARGSHTFLPAPQRREGMGTRARG